MLTAPVTAFISPNKSWKFIKGAFGPNRKGPEKVLLFLWNYPLLDFLFKDGIIRKINQGGLLDKIIVGILRREQKDLLQEEVLAIEHAFPGKEIQYVKLDSRDYLEHSKLCREIKPSVVILPMDRPIPAKAMEEGVVHVEATTGRLRRLLPARAGFDVEVACGQGGSHREKRLG